MAKPLAPPERPLQAQDPGIAHHTSTGRASLWSYARRRSPRRVIRDGYAYLNARWQLRKADDAGRARARGRILVENEGSMILGDRLRLDGSAVRLEFVTGPSGRLTIGDGTFLNYGTNISALDSVSIGRECNIGQYCIIMDSNYHEAFDHRKPDRPEPIVIEDDVWLGARVIVLKGSTIGRGATIGANSVVRGAIPAGAVAAGVPARVIRTAGPAANPPVDAFALA